MNRAERRAAQHKRKARQAPAIGYWLEVLAQPKPARFRVLVRRLPAHGSAPAFEATAPQLPGLLGMGSSAERAVESLRRNWPGYAASQREAQLAEDRAAEALAAVQSAGALWRARKQLAQPTGACDWQALANELCQLYGLTTIDLGSGKGRKMRSVAWVERDGQRLAVAEICSPPCASWQRVVKALVSALEASGIAGTQAADLPPH